MYHLINFRYYFVRLVQDGEQDNQANKIRNQHYVGHASPIIITTHVLLPVKLYSYSTCGVVPTLYSPNSRIHSEESMKGSVSLPRDIGNRVLTCCCTEPIDISVFAVTSLRRQQWWLEDVCS